MMRKSSLAALAAIAIFASAALAQTIVFTPSTTAINPAGGSLTFNALITYTSPPSVLAFSTTLPSGWIYTSTAGNNIPPITPQVVPISTPAGTIQGATGTLGWSYITTPASPASFSFTVNYPASLSGVQPLATSSVARATSSSTPVTNSGPTFSLAVPGAASVWNGGTDSWTTASAWTPGVVPSNAGGATYAAKISGGTAQLTSSITINDLLLLGGAINGVGTLNIAGSGSDWQAGTLSGLNELIIAPGAFFNATATASHDFSQTKITNQGQFIWTDSGSLRSGNGGSFVNASGAVFTDATNASLLNPARSAIVNLGGLFTFTNAGTYVKSGSTETKISAAFTNQGSIIVNAGNLHFDAAFTQTSGNILLANGATTQFDSGLIFAVGSLTGNGTVMGNVTNGAASGAPAILSPGSPVGQLAIQGSLSLLSTSQLIIDLAGTVKGVTYDFLSVRDTATLGGTLAVNLASGFNPTGTTFTVLTASSFTGGSVFSNIANGGRLLTSDGSGSFLVNYVSPSLTLSGFQFTPIPEPSTWALFATGLGALALAALRRRKR